MYRKRYGPNRRRNYRYSRTTRRSNRYRKRRTNAGSKIYYYKRLTAALNGGTCTVPSVSPLLLALNFSLNDLPSFGEFVSLYDMYKIKAVKVSFYPTMTQNVSTGAVNNVYASARFFSAIDYNDGSAPTTVDEVRQYSNCKYSSQVRPHVRFIRNPKIAISNTYSFSPWLSTAVSTENYFGLKVAAEATGATSNTYSIEATYYLAFKNVK